MEGKKLGGPWRDENGNYHASTQAHPLIEERAEEYSKDKWAMGYSKELEILRAKEGYIRGATEQEKITKREMIAEAKKWLKDNVDKYLYNTGGFEEYIPKCGGRMFADFEEAMLQEFIYEKRHL